MRIKEILSESLVHIDQSNDGGSLEGYVVDTDQPQLANYLKSQGAPNQLIARLIQQFTRIGIIRNMYVDDSLRGQGYGTKLVDGAISEAFDSGAQAIVLVADIHEDNNIDLVKWYGNYGFVVIGSASGDPVMLLEPDR